MYAENELANGESFKIRKRFTPIFLLTFFNTRTFKLLENCHFTGLPALLLNSPIIKRL
jgi:hypothetical protein